MSNATETLTLTEFLMERIAEEERRVDTIPDWYCTDSSRGDGWGSRGDCDLCDKYMFDGTESVTKEAFWDHMEGTHRRTFRLAECEAKRQAIEAAWTDHCRIEGEWGSCQSQEQMSAKDDNPEVVAALALPYADHSDYQDEWRP